MATINGHNLQTIEAENDVTLPYLSLLPKFYDMRGEFYRNFQEMNPYYPEDRYNSTLENALNNKKSSYDFLSTKKNLKPKSFLDQQTMKYKLSMLPTFDQNEYKLNRTSYKFGDNLQRIII